MSFRLEIFPGAFQRAMDVLRTIVKRQFALVYLDENFILLRTPDEHIDHATQVVEILYVVSESFNP